LNDGIETKLKEKNWKKKREKKTKYILKSRKFRLGSPRIESKFSKLNAKNEGKETNPDKEQTILEASKKRSPAFLQPS
jgi:hypothetical protein